MNNANGSTPRFEMDLRRVSENAGRFLRIAKQSFPQHPTRAFFALKSHQSFPILQVLCRHEFGCEAMTPTDIAWARSLCMPTIVSGFVKSEHVLASAILEAQYIVVETEQEIPRLQRLSEQLGASPSIILRVKVRHDAKLGCSVDSIEDFASRTGLNIKGLHFHAGWNVKREELIVEALDQLGEAKNCLRRAGRPIEVLNFGGSFCEHAADCSQLERRMALYAREVDHTVGEVHFEPGRYLVGDAGRLICTIEYVDTRAKALYLNTCAYGYALTGATPDAYLALPRPGPARSQWTLYGFWPAESDCLEGIDLEGVPRPGDSLVLRNMGAYILGLEAQFSVHGPASIAYVDGPVLNGHCRS